MKNIVITGSTSGLGLYMGLEFLRAGCNVTLSGRRGALTEEAQAALKPFEGKFMYVSCNVQEKPGLEKLWEVAAARWGGVDIWINNAGQNTEHVYAWESGEECTENVIKTNLIGMIFGSQVAAAGMLKQGHGAIYSTEGLGSNNMIQVKTILYGTSKHALTYFMQGLARELAGTGVIAGRLSPGMMLTDFIRKTPSGEQSEVITDEKFRKVFNILADKPEDVARFFVPKILSNTRNDARITWLTGGKAALRFMTAPFRKNRLI